MYCIQAPQVSQQEGHGAYELIKCCLASIVYTSVSMFLDQAMCGARDHWRVIELVIHYGLQEQ